MLKPIGNRKDPESEFKQEYKEFLDGLPVKNPKKLLFVNVPQVPANLFQADTAERDGYYNYPPIQYLYLSAAAKLAIPDIELKVLDLNFEMLRRCRLGQLDQVDGFWKELLDEEINGSDQLHVCVGNNWAIVTPMFLEVTRYIKDTFKNVTLVTGGVETTQNYKRVVGDDYCHIAFRYDAEIQFQAFLESCQQDHVTTVPDGIAFKVGDKFFETRPPVEPTPEFLDITPFYHLIDVSNYHKYGGLNPFARYLGNGKAYGTALSNRGCRAQCTFCGVLAFYPDGVRGRTARGVVDELKFLAYEKGVRLIDWLDDDLVYSKKRSVELFRLMSEELPSDFEWVAINGITGCAITEEIMYWMVKSGCKAFKVGIESGNEEMLKKIKKPASKDKLRDAGAIYNKYPEVYVSGNYMLGFPEETFGQIMDTFNFANELSWDWANYSICQPAFGTPVFDAFKELGDDRCNEGHFEGLIPARLASQAGNFGYENQAVPQQETNPIVSGREVFNLPYDQVPSVEQMKEIWFTFNIVTNFFNNRNFKPGGNLDKIIRWFEAILDSYPRDASMCAMLAHGHTLAGNTEQSQMYRDKFHSLCAEFDYWKRRVLEFPELLDFAG